MKSEQGKAAEKEYTAAMRQHVLTRLVLIHLSHSLFIVVNVFLQIFFC